MVNNSSKEFKEMVEELKNLYNRMDYGDVRWSNIKSNVSKNLRQLDLFAKVPYNKEPDYIFNNNKFYFEAGILIDTRNDKIFKLVDCNDTFYIDDYGRGSLVLPSRYFDMRQENIDAINLKIKEFRATSSLEQELFDD